MTEANQNPVLDHVNNDVIQVNDLSVQFVTSEHTVDAGPAPCRTEAAGAGIQAAAGTV